MSNVASPKKIEAYFDRFVVGQEEAKKDLAMLGFLHQIRFLMEQDPQYPETEGWKKPITGMIVGPTGCGKTYLLKLLARKINSPLLSINAAEMTNTGYVGNTFSDLIHQALDKVNGHEFSATARKRAVIFIDEFDKICTGLSSDGWSRRIQDSLLAPIEGQPIHAGNRHGHGELDLSKMLIILGGSFSHLVEKRSKEQVKYGFDKTNDRSKLGKISQAEIIEAGVRRELAGRIHTVTQVYPLTKEQLRKALTDTEENVLKDYARLLGFLGEPDVSPYEIDMIIEKASEENTKKDNNLGARALVNATNQVLRTRLEDVIYCYADKAQEDYP